MTQAGKARKMYLINNNETIKPKGCKYSRTGYCICKTVTDCAILTCEEGAIAPWEDQDGM